MAAGMMVFRCVVFLYLGDTMRREPMFQEILAFTGLTPCPFLPLFTLCSSISNIRCAPIKSGTVPSLEETVETFSALGEPVC